MAAKKIDWPHWYAVFREIHQTGNLSLADFCRRENLSYDTCRKAFKRQDQAKGEPGRKPRKGTRAQWDAWKLEFLAGDFKSVSDFVRSKGLDPSTGHISRMTKGWSKELGEIRAKSQAESVAQLADSRGAEALAKLHGRVLAGLYACLRDLEANGPVRVRLQQGLDGVKDSLDFTRNVSVAIDSLLKLLPAVSRIEAITATRTLLQAILDKGLDVTEAAIQFDLLGVSLPESLKILLSKAEAPEAEVPENEIPDDAELERRWRAGLDKIHEQTERFLPERIKEIEQLKAEYKEFDSFSDDAL